MATVTISAPLAAMACSMISGEGYFAVPTSRRERKVSAPIFQLDIALLSSVQNLFSPRAGVLPAEYVVFSFSFFIAGVSGRPTVFERLRRELSPVTDSEGTRPGLSKKMRHPYFIKAHSVRSMPMIPPDNKMNQTEAPSARLRLSRYVLAMLIIVLAALLRRALIGIIGYSTTYITFYPAVMLAAVIGGFGPGLLATVLAAMLADYYFIPPIGSFHIASIANVLSLSVFALMGLFMSVVAHRYQQAREKSAAFARELAVRQNEERYRLLFETMQQGVVLQDAAGIVIGMNPAAERILGRTPEEFHGCTSISVEYDTIRADGTPFPGMEHPAMVALHTGQIMRGVVMGVYNHRIRQTRWIDVTAVPLFRENENTPYQVYVVFEDISERKRAEEEVRQQREQLRVTLSSIGDAVLTTDSAGRITYLNPVAESLTGWRVTEAAGQPIQHVFAIVNEQTREQADDIVGRTLREGTTSHWRITRRCSAATDAKSPSRIARRPSPTVPATSSAWCWSSMMSPSGGAPSRRCGRARRATANWCSTPTVPSFAGSATAPSPFSMSMRRRSSVIARTR